MKTIISINSDVFELVEQNNIVIIDKEIIINNESFYFLKIEKNKSNESFLKVLYKGDVYKIFMEDLEFNEIVCDYSNFMYLIKVIKDSYNKI